MRRWLALLLATASVLALPAPASAATTFTQVSLTASVSGSSVTASASIRASATTTVQQLGICARDAAGRNLDFPGKRASAVLTTSALSFSATRTFPAGTHTYYPCFQLDGRWTGVGKATFTVGATPTTPGSPGWRRVYTQDFTTGAATRQTEQVYGSSVNGYHDATPTTWGNGGCYYPSRTLSAHDGVLDTHLHSQSGLPNGCRFLSAAPVPYGWHQQVYGQFSVRMRADPVVGYKTAFLLWPESNVWGDGEIDFPEADLRDPVTGAVHHLTPGDPNGFARVIARTTQTDWHLYTLQWYPGHVRMLIDGVLQQDFTADVPTTPHYWVLQTEAAQSAPLPTASGHVLVDSVSVDAYAG